MKIRRHRSFKKAFKKLPKKFKGKANLVFEKFHKNPFAKSLNNHPLHGRLQGKRAISVTGDIRIVFEEFDNYTLVLMLDIGKHSLIY